MFIFVKKKHILPSPFSSKKFETVVSGLFIKKISRVVEGAGADEPPRQRKGILHARHRPQGINLWTWPAKTHLSTTAQLLMP